MEIKELEVIWDFLTHLLQSNEIKKVDKMVCGLSTDIDPSELIHYGMG